MNIKQILVGAAVSAVMFGALATPAFATKTQGDFGPNPSVNGFNEFGYNYTARNFVGTGSSWCQGKLGLNKDDCDAYMGAYANDNLVMKWSKAWDDARFHGAPWTPDAWVDNEWNGQVPNGSGVSEHVKVIWIGLPADSFNPLWRDGGSAIWGEFETIFDHYVCSPDNLLCPTNPWQAKAVPAGYGGN